MTIFCLALFLRLNNMWKEKEGYGEKNRATNYTSEI